jgi:diguanylate cyclase (GGDEF)-like protein
MTHASMYMPYLMYAYAAAVLLMLAGSRICAWSVPGLRGMRLLSWSYGIALLGVLLLAARPVGPAWLTILVANQAIFGFALLTYCATAEILAVRMWFLPWGLGLQAASLAGDWYYFYIAPNLTARILIASGICAVAAIATAAALFGFREPDEDMTVVPTLRSLAMVLAWLEALVAAQHVVRCVLTVLYPNADASFMHLGLIQAGFSYLNMVLNAGMGCGLIWLALWVHRRDLHALAQTDSLTGLLNRRAFQEALVRELGRSGAASAPFSMMLIDIDRFKSVNDLWGHHAGDEAVCKVGWAMREALRPNDTLARFGGDEFAILLGGTNRGEAEEIAERLRVKVEGLNLQVGNVQITISIGVAECEETEVMEELLRRCDEALYRSKRGGRNRVTVYPSFP